MSCLAVEDIVYPHDPACFEWTAADQLACTAACRRDHPRAWKIRREQEVAVLVGEPYWTIYRRTPYSRRYVPAAAANTFADVLALLAQPLTPLDEDDHVSP